MATTTIIAIGGGGFTTGTAAGLDDFVLAQFPRADRRIGFIATASGDDPARIAAFHRLIAPRVAAASVLPSDTDAREAASWVAALDMVYVGGGDTARLLAHWRATGIDTVLRDAARAGVVLAGVSAGAICWFDSALARGADGMLARIDGLGLVPGSCCVHYTAEPERPGAFTAAIARGALADGIAIDDGVAVIIRGDAPPRAWSASPDAWAYSVRLASSSGVSSTPLPDFVNG